ncbi:uncharacterized protein EV154DRAFT_514395, partial [Mucor mucedo]|uniref:uncharacterized protein n=1 Tax=Mucor mucedo TaxID=29922 RepID=UPI00222129CA
MPTPFVPSVVWMSLFIPMKMIVLAFAIIHILSLCSPKTRLFLTADLPHKKNKKITLNHKSNQIKSIKSNQIKSNTPYSFSI